LEASPPGRFLAAEVAAEVNFDLVGAGITLATAVASLGSMRRPGGFPEPVLRSLPPELVDHPTDIDVDIGEAAIGGSVEGGPEAVFSGKRFAVGRVDRSFESLLAVGDHGPFADYPNRVPFRAADLEVDSFVREVLVGILATGGLFVDEFLRRLGVGGLDRDQRFGEFTAFEVFEGDARRLAQPRFHFGGEINRFAFAVAELSSSETTNSPRLSMPAIFLATESTFDFSAPVGFRLPST